MLSRIAGAVLSVALLTQFSVAANPLREEASRFAAACPANIARAPTYDRFSLAEREAICKCANGKVDQLFEREPDVSQASFISQYRRIVAACSREAITRLIADRCIGNQAEVRLLIGRGRLRGSEAVTFCSCFAEAVWDWQLDHPTHTSSQAIVEAGSEVAGKCDGSPQ
jgi:hypothetical protein